METEFDCCVVGGGPAGIVLALLLARQGVRVVLLEAHDNFDRDFRGDSVHPSTLELIDQLGLMDRLLALPHVPFDDFPVHLPDGTVASQVKRRLPGRFQATLSMRQSVLLDMLADAAGEYPTFTLRKGARVEQLVEEDGQVRGVRYRGRDGWHEVRAQLVVGADGRFSKIRQLARVSINELSQEVDVLWLRLPKSSNDPPRAHGLYPGERTLLVVGDRGDRWQIGFVFAKGAYQQMRDAGLQALRDRIAQTAPWLADRTQALEDWNQTSLLVVQSGRAQRWYRPGLLLIGDAAHVMSPVFGVGINYAIQDAIAASNRLGPRLLRGEVRTSDLAAVQKRRELPTRIMQFLQSYGEQNAVAGPLAYGWRERAVGALLDMRPLSDIRLRLVIFGGFRAERVDSVPLRQRFGRGVRRLALATLAAAEGAGMMALGAYGWWWMR
jgi:2-polyprenyl-6-methoxyphenol hydroxylase-like FAD-dependent oxidoreductase